MEFLPVTIALVATVSVLLTLLVVRMGKRRGRRSAARDALDTVAAWPPEAARILTINERQAYDLLRRAMPGFLVLAQVPLARFIRVPARHSYVDWLQRVGSLSADLMLCDSGSRVLAVIDIRAAQESARAQRRHERMWRVLRAAGIHVYTWREGQLPAVSEVRSALVTLVSPAEAAAAKPGSSRPMAPVPSAKAAEMADLLSHGDRTAAEADLDPALEPVPSAFFEELEPAAARRR